MSTASMAPSYGVPSMNGMTSGYGMDTYGRQGLGAAANVGMGMGVNAQCMSPSVGSAMGSHYGANNMGMGSCMGSMNNINSALTG